MKRQRGKGNLRLMPVYIPTGTLHTEVPPGTAFVGEWEFEAGRVMVDYEGNKYGMVNLTRFVERVHHAWDRHVQRYPTIARAWVQTHELTLVAEYDPLNKRVITNPLDLPKLEAWLGMSPIPEQELVL